MDPLLTWWSADTFQPGDDDAIFADQNWWNRLFDLLQEGQIVPNACAVASTEQGVKIGWDALKRAMESYPDLANRIRLAQSSRNMAARRKVGQAIETDVRVAKWYLDRTDPEFLPKQDLSGLSKMSEEELRGIADSESDSEESGA